MTQSGQGALRVLVCEDHPVLSDAFAMLIDAHPELSPRRRDKAPT